MFVTNFPPVPVKEGYVNGEHILELSDGSIEKFEDVWARLERKAELERGYDAAVVDVAQQLELT